MSKKSYVEVVMRRLPSETRGANISVTYLVFECPMGENCSIGGNVSFRANTGWSNPYRHLLICVSNGDEVHLTQYFESVRDNTNHNTGLRRLLTPNMGSIGPSSRERAMFDYIRMHTLLSLPLSMVESDALHRFSKYDYKFSEKNVKEVMLLLVELVEIKIGEEMRETKGAIVHDAWTNAGIHYIGVLGRTFASAKYGRERTK